MKTIFVYFSGFLPVLVANSIQNFLDEEINAMTDKRFKIDEYRSIASCIAKTCVTELFWKPTVVLKISQEYKNSEANFIYEIQKEFTAHNVMYLVMSNSSNRTLDYFDASYLFVQYFENCESMTQFDFTALKKKLKYLNVIEDYSTVECKNYFKGIGNVVGDYDISFLINMRGQYRLFTFIPYINHNTCKQEVVNPTLINICLKGKFTKRDIFPQKNPTDLMQCPFKVGMGPLFPFALIENKSSLQNYDPLNETRVKGLDYEIVKIMAEYFNATLQLHYIYKQEENPFVNVEYLQFVLNGSLEACAGGLYRIFGDVVEYSGIYARQSVMWIYSAEQATRTWDNMVRNIDGLYLFIVFYFSYSIAWIFICKFDKYFVSIGNTLLNSWGALLGTASLQDARTMKQKILNIVYLNMCLHLSVYISIQLFSFFTILDPPEILKSNDDIMKSGRTAYLKTLTKYFTQDEKYERFANTSVDCSGFLDCAQMALRNKGVTAYISGYFYSFQAETAVNDEARMLRSADNLLTVFYEMIIKKESPLVSKFQKIVVSLFEAGITEKLFEEAIGVTVVGKSKIATQNMVTSSYSCQLGCSLNLHQFSGVFYVWIFGCGISCCLFVLEILLKQRIRQV